MKINQHPLITAAVCVCVCVLHSIDILKYIIYGLAAGFFVFGVLLLVEGFFTTGAIRDLYGEFKITACGRCLTAFVRKTTRLHMWLIIVLLFKTTDYEKDGCHDSSSSDVKPKQVQLPLVAGCGIVMLVDGPIK